METNQRLLVASVENALNLGHYQARSLPWQYWHVAVDGIAPGAGEPRRRGGRVAATAGASRRGGPPGGRPTYPRGV